MTDPRLLPSACHDGIGTPDCIAFAAQYVPLSTLRVLPHSRAAWIATPSLSRTCTVYLLPVSRRTAAQWLAYALPYRRFVGVLTDANARLGVDVDRYSFIVVDLHHLLLAGLPAHFESSHPSHAVGSLWAMSGCGIMEQRAEPKAEGARCSLLLGVY